MLSDAAGKRYRDGKKSTRALTPTWGGVLCRRLLARKLLTKRTRKTRSNGAATTFYSLPDDFEGRRRLTLYYLRSWEALVPDAWVSRSSWSFLSSQFARAYVTPSMVRTEFARRKIVMNVSFDAPRELWRPHEMTGPFAGRRFSLRLRVAAPDDDVSTLVAAALDDIQMSERNLEPSAIKFLEQCAREHYASGENEKLIVPVTALCQTSPRALLDLLVKWDPYPLDMTQTPEIGMVEHVLFRMVFDAVQDLSITRNTPEGVDVTFATVGPENGGCVPESSTLLELDWRYDHRIGFAAGFDTDHALVFGEDVEAGGVESERNPENAWVKIAWTKVPLLGFMDPDLSDVERAIGHSFLRKELLNEALTHSSLLNEPRGKGRKSNQRLAHLGDAVLELIVRSALFDQLPHATKGQLTDAKKDLVRNSTLASITRTKQLGDSLERGKSQAKVPANDRVLAEAFEALVGAVFLDSDLETVTRVVTRLAPVSVSQR